MLQDRLYPVLLFENANRCLHANIYVLIVDVILIKEEKRI